MKIFRRDLEEPVRSLVTEDDGKYEAGPLDAAVDYTIVAEKEGYVITGPDAGNNFKAHKLAEIVVEVLSEATETPLQASSGPKFAFLMKFRNENVFSVSS